VLSLRGRKRERKTRGEPIESGSLNYKSNKCQSRSRIFSTRNLFLQWRRTLIKSGHKKVMRVFGYAPPIIRNTIVNVITPELEFGGALEFSLSMTSDSGHDQALMMDYIIHHRKANGKTSPKVFKWRIKTLEANKTLTVTKKHVIKKITTRVYYPGVHTVEVMVNGISVGAADFNLRMP